MKTLSKSSYCSGVQCPKILWLKTHCPDEALISESTQNTFDMGHTVGDYAKTYFGDYVEVPMDFEHFSDAFKNAVEATKNHITNGTPTVCEAAFGYKNALCFADILRTNPDGTIEIIEVKQSADLKPQHLDDMAFQYYVITNCGYQISKISLMHINSKYVRKGDIEPQKLFSMVDCTQEVLDKQKDIQGKIEQLLQYSEQKAEPEMQTGDHCSKPYACAYWAHCHTEEEVNPKKQQAIADGVKVNKEAIQDFLAKLRYPLYYFDFETTCLEPLPLVDGASPYYPPTPFQYSLHIQKTKDEDISKLEHREFLAHELTNESVRALAEQMCRDIPKDAMVMAYNMTFEKGVIERLAEMFPDLSDHLLAIHSNFVDLMKPFQSKYLRTPEMEGSYSIKKVLPALVPDLRYSDLEVQSGDVAYSTFKTLSSLSPEEKEKKCKALLAYCELDTLAMVRILKKLEQIAEESKPKK
jgi:hypothetical protein